MNLKIGSFKKFKTTKGNLLHLNINQKGRLYRKENTIYFEQLDENNEKIKVFNFPINKISSINILNNVQFDSEILYFLNLHKIRIDFFNHFSKKFFGSFEPNDFLNVNIMFSQFELLKNNQFELFKRLDLIEETYFKTVLNMQYFLSFYQKRKNNIEITKIKKNLMKIYKNNFQKEIKKQKESQILNLENLMLFEGQIWNEYYKSFDLILLDGWDFNKRSKFPPENFVNSLISFANMNLYKLIVQKLKEVGIDEKISYYHALNDTRYSLALDLSEYLKPLYSHKFIIKLLNEKKIIKSHFKNDGTFNLNDEGIKIFYINFLDLLNKTIFNKKLNRNVSLEYTIKLELYKYLKFIKNEEKEINFINFNDKNIKIEW